MGTQKQRSILVFALPIILAVVSLGCGLSGLMGENTAVQIQPPPTRTPMPTFTPTSGAVAGVQPPDDAPQQDTIAVQIPTETPTAVVPTDTPEPTPSPTNTPVAEPQVTILQNMNVRGGPGTGYPVIGPGPAGESSKIIGRNADGSWVQVKYPSADGTGWVYVPLVRIDGDLSSIPVVQVASPPAPPPAPAEAPAEEPAEPAEPPPPPPPKYQFTPTGWHASGNAGLIQFKGRIRDEGGNLVNGYSVLLDNWSWSVLSHPSGPSRHYPQKGPGEWDVVIAENNLGSGLGWWWLTVVRYDCENFDWSFNAQCKQFTRLSEDVKIMVNWPDETIINADWVCHWDCDKGLYTELYTGN
jgi:uncharacterized protein YraI